MKTLKTIITNVCRNLLKKGLVLGLIAFILLPSSATAIIENLEFIPPQPVQKDMYTALNPSDAWLGGWGQKKGGSSGRKCGYQEPKFNNAGWTWISAVNNNADQEVEIRENADSVDLWLNATAAICDSIINSAGRVTDTTLKESKTKLFDAYAQVEGTNNILRDIDGLLNPDLVIRHSWNFNYNDGSGNQRRYVKANGAQPFHQPFTLNGLKALNLKARKEPYIIHLYTKERGINRFVYGDGSTVYRCINGAKVVTSTQFDYTKCPEAAPEIKATLTLRVVDSSGLCEISSIRLTNSNQTIPKAQFGQPIYVNPGDTFDVNFAVTNTGGDDWKVGSYDPAAASSKDKIALGPKSGSITGGKNREFIPGYTAGGQQLIYGSSGPANRRSQSLTGTGFRVASNASGDLIFRWTLVKEQPTRSVADGSCPPINFKIRENRPFLGVLGGDTMSGASFGPACQPNVDGGATQAAIKTNGYYNNQNAAEGLSLGFSGSQYAVFSSGQIGNNSDASTTNTYLGNLGFSRNSLNQGKSYVVKDALFANIGAPKDYGDFYAKGEAGLPCVDVQELTAGARAAVGGETPQSVLSRGGDEVIEFSGSKTLAGNIQITGKKTIVISGGDLTVGANISYKPEYSSAESIPSLTVVVRGGNLLINGNSTNLDGQYVVVPTADNQKGLIDTCAGFNGAAGQWPVPLAIGSCPNRLIVNGSLTARRVLWKRTGGTVGAAAQAANAGCAYASFGQPLSGIRNCAAELVEFNPERYLNFGPPEVDSLPKSSTELPPIY